MSRKSKSLCTIRPDLVEAGLGIPIEGKAKVTIYLRGNSKRQYQWTDDSEGFYIKYRGNWCLAQSIDFEF
jgi:hypothetical protein